MVCGVERYREHVEEEETNDSEAEEEDEEEKDDIEEKAEDHMHAHRKGEKSEKKTTKHTNENARQQLQCWQRQNNIEEDTKTNFDEKSKAAQHKMRQIASGSEQNKRSSKRLCSPSQDQAE